ncbi:MAG: Ig-like domain-containing protein [Nocardioides sp.]
MKLDRIFRRRTSRTRRLVSGTSLALVASVLVVLAAKADGLPISDVDLNDGSVWVVNQAPDRQLLAKLNTQIRQLDLGVQAQAGEFDVFQDGPTVFLDQRGGARSLRRVDVAAGVLGDPIELPTGAVAAYGGGTVALLDAESGKAWVRSVDTIQGFTVKLDPDLELGADAAVAVGLDGTAWFVNPARHTVTPVRMVAGLPEVGDPEDLGGTLGESLQVTLVGDHVLVLDRESGSILQPGSDPVKVESADPLSAKLQLPGPSSDSAYVATREQLLTLDIGGDDLTTIRDGFDGPPAAPLVHRGFVHAAWADPAAESYVRLQGKKIYQVGIPSVQPTAALVFRRNRDAVVLNDTTTGDSWLVQQEGIPLVKNWDDVDPKVEKEQQQDPRPQEQEVKRTEENRKPEARDDELGARAGQETILPVIRNDVDPDGDILTIQDPPSYVSGPKAETIAVVGDGTQLQMRFRAQDSGGQAVYKYVADDGREGVDDAELTINIVPATQNSNPERVMDDGVPRETRVTLSAGQKTTIYAMPDWTDPDGDGLVLDDAQVKSGGSLLARPDGLIEFQDDGRPGDKVIEFDILDGRGGKAHGKIPVTVTATGGASPTLVPDRVLGEAGSWIEVKPLANDFSRDGSDLHLRNVNGVGGLEVKLDPTTGTFLARTSRAGTYYLDYSVYTDRAEGESFVRLDVQAQSDANRPPVAMKDEALIPKGGYALIDPLANDVDPEGQVLAITSVSAPGNSGVKASLIENRLLRIETNRDLASPVSLSYVVSDGPNSVQGSVTVQQLRVNERNRPPVAGDDRVTARVGSVSSVAVLANDSDPDNDDLRLFQQDLVVPDDMAMFVSGSRVRFKAPDKPGEYRVTYGVRDSRGQRDDAEIVIEVKPDDPEENSAPRPHAVEARAIGGQVIRINLDLAGSDPDGDAVTLVGLTRAPELGRVVKTGLDWISYEPYSGRRTGTDTIEAQVRDSYGQMGEVSVRVGVIPRAAVNQAPVALDDRLSVRPDRTIAYNVASNDADPDGDALQLAEDLQANAGTDAALEGQFLVLKVPDVDGESTKQVAVTYAIEDGLGGSDQARFTVDASEDAPLYAPTTRDDVAAASRITGKSPGDTVAVDVLANDGDLDGRQEDLTVEPWDAKAATVVDKKLKVTLTKRDQVVVYRVKDAEDQQSFGFVFVSGTESAPPVVNPEAVPIEVTAGEPKTVQLSDVVLVRAGRAPIITVPDQVRTEPFSSGVEVVDRESFTVTAPADASGPASVTLEVTDGEGLNDPTGESSLLTIPIDVIASKNLPPTMRDLFAEVATGPDTEEKRIDLRAAAADPNEKDLAELTFEAVTEGEVDAQIEDGSVLVLTPQSGAVKDQTAKVTVTAADPGGAKGQGTVHVTFVSSDRPLVTVGDIGPLEGKAGEALELDINDYAQNPYSDDPLTVENASLEVGEGAASASGSIVTVTPKTDFSGTLVVKFSVLDGSGDRERVVTARAEVVVVARPEPPGRPTVAGFTADTVTLSWAPADDKGAPVTDYEVRWRGGEQSCGAATTCIIDGLTPSQTYTFEVVATNRVGTSEPSPPSDPATPDEVPERMAAPTVSPDYTQRDGQLIIQWVKPANTGSPIEFYEISMLGSSQVRQAPEGSRSFPWTGLTNGEIKQFRIRAVNDIKDNRMQDFSDPSQPDKPFTVPDPVGQPVAQASADDGVAGGIVTVSWEAPENNGDDIDTYEVTMAKNGTNVVTKTIDGALHTTSFDGVENGNDYTFQIAGHNRAGLGEKSQRSEKVNPYDKASPVQNIRKVSEGDHYAKITFDRPADDGGREIIGYDVSSTGGSTVRFEGTSGDVHFNENNGPYKVWVVPVTSLSVNVELLGQETAPLEGVRPFGIPLKPVGLVSTEKYMAVDLGWSVPDENGRPIIATQWKSTGGWNNGTSTTQSTIEGGESACVELRTVSEGATSADRLYSTAIPHCGQSKPKEVTVVKGGQYNNCESTCYYVDIYVEGFKANTTQYASPSLNGDPNWCGQETPCSNTKSFRVGGDGKGSLVNWYYNGYSGNVCVRVDDVTGCHVW